MTEPEELREYTTDQLLAHVARIYGDSIAEVCRRYIFHPGRMGPERNILNVDSNNNVVDFRRAEH